MAGDFYKLFLSFQQIIIIETVYETTNYYETKLQKVLRNLKMALLSQLRDLFKKFKTRSYGAASEELQERLQGRGMSTLWVSQAGRLHVETKSPQSRIVCNGKDEEKRRQEKKCWKYKREKKDTYLAVKIRS